MSAGQRTYDETIPFSGHKFEGDRSFLDAYVDAIISHTRIAVLDTRCRIVWVNDRFCIQTKYSQQELVGQQIAKLNLVFLQPEELQLIFSTISKGEKWSGEIKSRAKDGTHLWLKVNVLPTRNRNNEITSYLIFTSNITATKNALDEKNEALENLQKSEARYRVLVENQPDLISLCSADGTRIYVNSSYCRFMGMEADELIGTSACEVSLKGLPHHFKQAGLQLSPGNPEISDVFELENSNGRRLWISLCLRGIFDSKGDLYEILTIGRNVTELKNAELRKSNYIDDLERIAFMTSHNVRGPIATMLGLIELLKMHAIHSEQWDHVMDSFRKCIIDLDGYTRELGAFINHRQSSK